MRKPLSFLVMAVVLGGSGRVLAESVYKPPDPEPTDAETLLLEYINRFRADPAAEARRVKADPGAHGEKREIAWDVFIAELGEAKAVPPLVMNLKLLLAARRHAYYLAINNKRGHLEENELSGFTGEKMPIRVTEAGYIWKAWYENVYAAPDPWAVHAGFVVDFSAKTPDGMSPDRGHRKNMLRPELREAGTGAYKRERDFIYTEGFGDRKDAVRLVGGVVFADKDGDAFYGLGEGKGGVTVRASDGSHVKTWKSGAYALELTTADAVTITFERGGQKKVVELPAGRENAKIDWILSK